jgi:hypothetical protein
MKEPLDETRATDLSPEEIAESERWTKLEVTYLNRIINRELMRDFQEWERSKQTVQP